MDENERYQRAKKRVEDLKGFYIHLVSYICVIGFLVVINLMTMGYLWVIYPALGWGAGLAIHAFVVYIEGSRWEERKIRQLMAQDDNRKVKNEDYFQQPQP